MDRQHKISIYMSLHTASNVLIKSQFVVNYNSTDISGRQAVIVAMPGQSIICNN